METGSKNAHKRKTVLSQLLLPIMAVLLVQALLQMALFVGGGLLEQSDDYAFAMFQESVRSRHQALETDMRLRWSELSQAEGLLQETFRHILLKEGKSHQEIQESWQLNEALLMGAVEPLVEMLKTNGVTGAFVILEGPGLPDQRKELARASLYLRNLEPARGSLKPTDLLMQRGLPSISQVYQIPLDRFWQPVMRFSIEGVSKEEAFYFKPFYAPATFAGNRSSDYGYWSPAFRLEALDMEVITYSVPLIGPEGGAYGVMGVEINSHYLGQRLAGTLWNETQETSLVLGRLEKSQGILRPEWTMGSLLYDHFGPTEALKIHDLEQRPGYLEIQETKAPGEHLYANIRELNLYDQQGPFAQDVWVVAGLIEEEDLLSFSKSVEGMLKLTTLVAIILGLLGAYLASRKVSEPIARLAQAVEESDPRSPLLLEKLEIYEIDTLTAAIETMRRDVAESASKTSKILDLTQVLVGVFEYAEGEETVYCSKNWFYLTNSSGYEIQDQWIPREAFEADLERLELYRTDAQEQIYKLPTGGGRHRWIRLKSLNVAPRILGAVVDITKEMEEMERTEYERDYDVLTGLYNRRAFEQLSRELFFGEKPVQRAALIMWDLDNLKYINDTYGHDYGDQYIQAFSQILKKFNHEKGLAARRSGDEFYVLLHDYSQKELILDHIERVWNAIQQTTLYLPGGEGIRIRVSAGIAWYPEDARNLEELLRFADFAMYHAKNTKKGDMASYDALAYMNKAYLLNATEALNTLIEKKQVRYAFQPIVEASSGKVFGYEMLMRPQVKELRGPLEVLMLARHQSKLHLIETLTFFEGMATFVGMLEKGRLPDTMKVFLNSISSHMMPEKEGAAFQKRYEPYLKNIVVELTENEPSDNETSWKKLETARSWGCQLAIDDFGSGYNSEMALIFLAPDFVKVDASIVRGIDTDLDRQNILENLLSYSQKRGIKIVAEGVETSGEMALLIEKGVDYLQGYYIARPAFEPPVINTTLEAEIRRLWEHHRS